MEDKIKKYGPRLFGLCMTLVKNKEAANDLYQDTWLRAWEKQNQYDSTYAYESWLTTICVNRYRDYLRRSRLTPFFNLFGSIEEKDRLFENVAVEEKEDYSHIRQAVDNLPSKYREAVILFYFQNKNVNETALIMNLPAGTVKTRLMKARKLLKEVLEDEWNL